MVLDLKSGSKTAISRASNSDPGSNIIIFTSARGGSGCSFLAYTVAEYMARKTTLNVVLVDLNVGRMDSRMVFNLDSYVKDMGELQAPINNLDTNGLKKIVINMEDSLNIILPSLDRENRDIFNTESLNIFTESLRDHFDLVIMDMTADLLSQLDLEEIDISDRFVVVTLPDSISAYNTRLLNDHIRRYRSSNDIYLAVNKYNLRSSVSPTGLSNIIQHPVAAFIPYDRDIENMVNTRGPGSIFRYELKVVRNISALAKSIYQELEL